MITFKRLRLSDKSALTVIRLGPVSYTWYQGEHNLDVGPNWHIRRRSRVYRAVTTMQHHWHYRWRWSPRPIYWDRYSRDCDQYAVSWCERHPNGWKAYASYCDALDNAEGPERFTFITRAEYERHKDERHTRDHAAEQMNY